MTVFFISDTHFGHQNILRLSKRPFRTIAEHDEALVAHWNATVGHEDVVYHLGDFAYGLDEDADRLNWLFSRLQGRKHLVLGNHDLDGNGRMHPTIAGLGWEARPEHLLHLEIDGGRLVLSHYAQREWQGGQKGAFHFYGHAHGALAGIGRSRDVGVDMPDVAFRPRTFAELTRGMK